MVTSVVAVSRYRHLYRQGTRLSCAIHQSYIVGYVVSLTMPEATQSRTHISTPQCILIILLSIHPSWVNDIARHEFPTVRKPLKSPAFRAVLLTSSRAFYTSGADSEADSRARPCHCDPFPLRCGLVPAGYRSAASLIAFRLGSSPGSSHPVQQVFLCLEQASLASRSYLARASHGFANGCSHLDCAAYNKLCLEYCGRYILHGILRK